jgi:hypothetical protein
MHFWTNVRDWLGGWPMEFVKESECVDFCNKELGLELVAQHTGEANSEFLFRPSGVSNYWDAVLAEQREISLPQPYENVGGYMWRVHIPALLCIASTSEVPRKSDAVLTENGRIIGYRHASHEAIAVWGGGGYSHWGEYLFFSTSDNTSPNENGRRYSLRLSSAIMNETKICAE